MEIEGKKLNEKLNYLDLVTYVPGHVKGNAGHPDCDPGVIIGLKGPAVRVLYSKSRKVQLTSPVDLVWG